MMLTISGIPKNISMFELKVLVAKACPIDNCIFDKFIDETRATKKIRIGLADETSGLAIVNILDGYMLNKYAIRVEIVGKEKSKPPAAVPPTLVPKLNKQKSQIKRDTKAILNNAIQMIKFGKAKTNLTVATSCILQESNIAQETDIAQEPQTDLLTQSVPQYGTIVDCLKRRAEEFRNEMNSWSARKRARLEAAAAERLKSDSKSGPPSSVWDVIETKGPGGVSLSKILEDIQSGVIVIDQSPVTDESDDSEDDQYDPGRPTDSLYTKEPIPEPRMFKSDQGKSLTPADNDNDDKSVCDPLDKLKKHLFENVVTGLLKKCAQVFKKQIEPNGEIYDAIVTYAEKMVEKQDGGPLHYGIINNITEILMNLPKTELLKALGLPDEDSPRDSRFVQAPALAATAPGVPSIMDNMTTGSPQMMTNVLNQLQTQMIGNMAAEIQNQVMARVTTLVTSEIKAQATLQSQKESEANVAGGLQNNIATESQQQITALVQSELQKQIKSLVQCELQKQMVDKPTVGSQTQIVDASGNQHNQTATEFVTGPPSKNTEEPTKVNRVSGDDAAAILSRRAQVIVRMKGLPYNVTSQQVLNFFAKCVEPVEVLGGAEGVFFVQRRANGRPTGEAFVMFGKEEDWGKVLSQQRKHIGCRYIELFRSTAAFLQEVSSAGGTKLITLPLNNQPQKLTTTNVTTGPQNKAMDASGNQPKNETTVNVATGPQIKAMGASGNQPKNETTVNVATGPQIKAMGASGNQPKNETTVNVATGPQIKAMGASGNQPKNETTVNVATGPQIKAMGASGNQPKNETTVNVATGPQIKAMGASGNQPKNETTVNVATGPQIKAMGASGNQPKNETTVNVATGPQIKAMGASGNQPKNETTVNVATGPQIKAMGASGNQAQKQTTTNVTSGPQNKNVDVPVSSRDEKTSKDNIQLQKEEIEELAREALQSSNKSRNNLPLSNFEYTHVICNEVDKLIDKMSNILDTEVNKDLDGEYVTPYKTYILPALKEVLSYNVNIRLLPFQKKNVKFFAKMSFQSAPNETFLQMVKSSHDVVSFQKQSPTVYIAVFDKIVAFDNFCHRKQIRIDNLTFQILPLYRFAECLNISSSYMHKNDTAQKPEIDQDVVTANRNVQTQPKGVPVLKDQPTISTIHVKLEPQQKKFDEKVKTEVGTVGDIRLTNVVSKLNQRNNDESQVNLHIKEENDCFVFLDEMIVSDVVVGSANERNSDESQVNLKLAIKEEEGMELDEKIVTDVVGTVDNIHITNVVSNVDERNSNKSQVNLQIQIKEEKKLEGVVIDVVGTVDNINISNVVSNLNEINNDESQVNLQMQQENKGTNDDSQFQMQSSDNQESIEKQSNEKVVTGIIGNEEQEANDESIVTENQISTENSSNKIIVIDGIGNVDENDKSHKMLETNSTSNDKSNNETQVQQQKLENLTDEMLVTDDIGNVCDNKKDESQTVRDMNEEKAKTDAGPATDANALDNIDLDEFFADLINNPIVLDQCDLE